ncbi:MAG: DMT family transporter [Armatimonadota bacterium]|nr:DMT family transporter [Armatimonadota bacterium]
MDAHTIGALVVTLTTWASAFAAIRIGLRDFAPGHLALLRFLTASAVLAGLSLARHWTWPRRTDWPLLALSGFLSVTVYHTALNHGEVTVTAGAASFLINTAPIWTALFATYLLGETLPRAAWSGIALSFSGVALIAIGENMDELQRGLVSPGAFLILLSALSASAAMILNKNLLRTYNVLQLTSYTVWMGTFFLLVFTPNFLTALRTVPPRSAWCGVYLGVFPGALAYLTWTYVLSRLPAAKTATFLYLVPPLAVLIAWLWIGEAPTLFSLLGGMMALGGVVLVNTRRRPKPPEPPPLLSE